MYQQMVVAPLILLAMLCGFMLLLGGVLWWRSCVQTKKWLVLFAGFADALKADNGPRAEEKLAAEEAMKSTWSTYLRVKNGWREEEKRHAAIELDTARAEQVRSGKDLEHVARLQPRSIASP